MKLWNLSWFKTLVRIIVSIGDALSYLLRVPQGAAQTVDSTTVMAGIDAVVYYDGDQVAFATDISWDEDFELQGIRTLGFHGDRDFKSVGYTCTVTVGTFVLSGGGVLETLPTPTRSNILQQGLLDFEVHDRGTDQTLFILKGCKCSSQNISFSNNQLSQKGTRWRCREALPVEVS